MSSISRCGGGQFPYLEEHIAQMRAIYESYKEGLKDLPVQMNPFETKNGSGRVQSNAYIRQI